MLVTGKGNTEMAPTITPTPAREQLATRLSSHGQEFRIRFFPAVFPGGRDWWETRNSNGRIVAFHWSLTETINATAKYAFEHRPLRYRIGKSIGWRAFMLLADVALFTFAITFVINVVIGWL